MSENSSVAQAIGVFALFLVSEITLQQWAAISTIFAGVMAGAYTIYKWIHHHKKK